MSVALKRIHKKEEPKSNLTINRDQHLIVEKALENPLSSMRGLLTNNLYYFVQYFWSEYSQETFIPNWHIGYICKQLEKVAKDVSQNKPNKHDIIINVPPGSSKTAIVSIMFPLWCWVNWFWMRFITASYTSPLSLESAEYSRDVMRSDKFKQMFPELGIKIDKDTKSNFKVVKFKQEYAGRAPRHIQGGNRYSTSVGGTVTGFHGHILIWDDPIDPQRAVSDTRIKEANHWMTNTLPFRKVNKKVAVTIGIMQRLHPNDPTGHLLELKKKRPIKHICIPGEIKNYSAQVKPQKLIKRYSKDGLLDSARLGWDVLTDFQELGQFTYGGQIGQDPVPLGGGMFKVDNFITIDMPPHYLEVANTIRYWDKAATEGGGAYTAGVKMAKLKNGKIVVLDVKRGQWATEKREAIIRATAEADGKKCVIWIEQEPGSGGKDSAIATIRNLLGYVIRKECPTGDKAQRADPYSVQVNNGNVMILRADWNKDYKDELRYFPGSTYKDQGDASSGAFNRLAGKKKVRVGGSRGGK